MAEEFSIREAVARDLGDVLLVQQRAFGRVARMYDIPPANLPPLVESLDDLSALHSRGVRFFVAQSPSEAIVGSVRAEEHDGTVEIGRLVVDDGWERRGVAKALMALLEASFPAAVRFELFTGAEADVPLRLYDKLGYRTFRTQQVNGVDLVWLQKEGPGAVP